MEKKKPLVRLYVVLERKKKQPVGNHYTYRKLNPWHPLTYIMLIIAIFIAGFQGAKERICEVLGGVFKWK